MARPGILIVLSGPSGTGKGTICKELLQNYSNINYSISTTTRSPRAGEVNGVNYWFIAQEEFQSMVKNDELLEWAEVYGNYYGTPRRYVADLLDSGKDVVLEIDTQGAMQVKAKFPQGVFIYIVPPSIDELANRIYKRGSDSPEAIEKRLGCVRNELTCAYRYNYIVVNDQIAEATAKISAIINAEKCRVDRNTDLIDVMGK
ncbi:MAG: gmk 2 [Firmicutes bacterium]|nr:gmk 2 [Bacillota bacterium]